MEAVVLTGHGGPEKLEFQTLPIPRPGEDQVLIKVSAASINNSDLNARTGWYGAKTQFSHLLSDSDSKQQLGGGSGGVLWGQAEPDSAARSGLEFPLIQGADICGHIVEVGSSQHEALIGKRVICDPWVRSASSEDVKSIGAEINGGFAQYAVIPRENVYVINSSHLSDLELAAIPCAYATAQNMLHKARVTKDDLVLILGASGGVGSALVQLVKLRGARSIAIVGNEEKEKEVREFGADFAYTRHDPDLEEILTRNHRITACMDPVCGRFFPIALRVLTIHGRYSACGAISHPLVSCDARNIIYKDLELYGATRYPPEIFDEIVQYVEAGALKPAISKSYPLRLIHQAQIEFQNKAHFGKIVLKP